MPAPLIRDIPPGGLPGELIRPVRQADGTSVYIGAADITDAGSDPATVQAWTAATQDAGRVPVRFPTGILKGQLASRRQTPDPVKGWDYQLAPFAVRVADNARAANDTLQIAAGDIAAALEAASKAVLAAPANALSWALGLPKWVIYLGGALLVYGIATQVLPRSRGWRMLE